MTPGWTISAAIRLVKPFSRWVCVLAAAAFGVLAAPGLARAASSTPGLGDAAAQIQSALAQVDAVAPGTAAAAQPAVDQALAAAAAATTPAPQAQPPAPQPDQAPAAAPPAPPAPPATAATPTQIVSDAVAPVAAALGVPNPVPATAPPAAEHAPLHAPISLAKPARAASVAAGRGRVASVSPAAAGAAPQAAALMTPRAAPAGERASARRPQHGRSPGTGSAGALPPKPLPPAPPGPGQDFTSPMQTGGTGQLAPLLVAALAAALALTRFPFRTRLLPRSAFRKPRRVVLPVWHPG